MAIAIPLVDIGLSCSDYYKLHRAVPWHTYHCNCLACQKEHRAVSDKCFSLLEDSGLLEEPHIQHYLLRAGRVGLVCCSIPLDKKRDLPRDEQGLVPILLLRYPCQPQPMWKDGAYLLPVEDKNFTIEDAING